MIVPAECILARAFVKLLRESIFDRSKAQEVEFVAIRITNMVEITNVSFEVEGVHALCMEADELVLLIGDQVGAELQDSRFEIIEGTVIHHVEHPEFLEFGLVNTAGLLENPGEILLEMISFEHRIHILIPEEGLEVVL